MAENRNNTADRYCIDKVSLDGDYVRVTVSDEKTDTEFIVSALEYFDLGYKIGQDINGEVYEKLKQLHAISYAYRRCLRKIASHDQSVSEIRDFLGKLRSVDEKQAEQIIDKLLKQGLLDDQKLVETQFEYDQLKLQGHRKTAYDLKKRGVKAEIVDAYADNTDCEQETERGLLKAEQLLKGMDRRSYRETVQQLKAKLMNAGYDSDTVNKIISRLNYRKDDENERNNLKAFLERAYVRYSRKYSGSQLKSRLYAYLVSRGFNGEDIKSEINSYLQEGEDNEDQ